MNFNNKNRISYKPNPASLQIEGGQLDSKFSQNVVLCLIDGVDKFASHAIPDITKTLLVII